MAINLLFLSIKFLFAVVLTETITNIVSKSGFFLFFREFLFSRVEKSFIFNYAYDLVTCPYCLSVWVGWFSVVVLGFTTKVGFLDPYFGYFLVGLIVHRMSNILHYLIDRVDSRMILEDPEDLLENHKIEGFNSEEKV